MKSPSDLAARLAEVRWRIDGAAAGHDVRLIAVSKTHPPEAVHALWKLGQRDFGENYVQELLAKSDALDGLGATGIRWHLIGHVQTNKVKSLVGRVAAIHSIDSERLARELSRRWQERGNLAPVAVFLEVNLNVEESKSGTPPDAVLELAATVEGLPGLDLRGLMCIPSPEAAASGEPFRRLRQLEAKCRPHTQGELSMGMTQDFEIAIRNGATHVRIGTALFGPRGA